MDLTQYEGGDYLKAGDYDVTVGKQETFTGTQKGTKGVSYVVTDGRGSASKASFWLTKKSAWRLANFAKGCGLTSEQRADFTYDMLCGRTVRVRVVPVQREGKTYHEVDTDDFWPVGTDTTPPREGAAATVQHPSTLPEVEDTRGADDIPF